MHSRKCNACRHTLVAATNERCQAHRQSPGSLRVSLKPASTLANKALARTRDRYKMCSSLHALLCHVPHKVTCRAHKKRYGMWQRATFDICKLGATTHRSPLMPCGLCDHMHVIVLPPQHPRNPSCRNQHFLQKICMYVCTCAAHVRPYIR